MSIENIPLSDESQKSSLSAPRRNAKDTVFTDLFRDPKYVLQLYQCLHPEDTTTTADQIEIITLKSVLTNRIYNDLGFMPNDRLIIVVEDQSTWTVNILLRVLMYLVQHYQEYLNRTGKEQSIYKSKKLDIPKPELYVLYTGSRKIEKDYLSLAEEFFDGDNSVMDIKVKIICDGEQGDIINQYVRFAGIFDEHMIWYRKNKSHVNAADVIKEIFRTCMEQHILMDYLKQREQEVVTLMTKLFDDEQVFKDYIVAERREALEEGRAEGYTETLFTNLKNLIISTGMSIEQALNALMVPEAERPKYIAMLEQ